MALSEEQRIEKSKRHRLAANKRKKNPINKLTRKFKKNGLNSIHARYNALCIYYTYKSSKERRKLCGELACVDDHPISWSFNQDDFSVYQKNKYDFLLEFLYFLAGIFKFFTIYKFIFNSIKSSVRAIHRKTKKRKLKLKKLKRRIANIFHFLVPTFACIAVFLIIKNINTYDVAVKVNIDGEYFGIVKSVSDVEDIKTMIEKDISPVMNFSYSFTHSIEYVLVPVKKTECLTESEIYNKIYSLASDTLTNAYGLYIDGKLIGAVDNKEALDKILESVLNAGETAENEKIEYANDVQIIKQQYSKAILTTPEIIKVVLESSVQISKSAEISDGEDQEITSPEENPDYEGEAVAAFAADASLMGSVNPEYIPAQPLNSGETGIDIPTTGESRIDSPTIGESMLDSQMGSAVSAALTEAGKSNSISRGVADTVKNEMSKKIFASINNDDIINNITSDSESYYPSELVLKRIRNESYNETIPFTVEYRDSGKYYIGTEVTLSEGEDGINYATDSVTYIGDEEVGRVRIATVALKHPQNKIILKGSMQQPKAVPTGNFVIPVTPLYVAAGFNLTGEGEAYHRGIDYVANYGAPIYASDGGTVTFAGEGTPWSYGIYVKISHSNGMETVYAHMSETTVKTGEKVFQGQIIGKVGSTGNSFGDHLHFEMFKNGSLVDPKSYLKK